MKTYRGYPKEQAGAGKIDVIEKPDDNGSTPVKKPLEHVVRHSPTGMNWGYGGSGPSDTALSILTDCFGPTMAEKYYQKFKRDVVAGLPIEAEWEITEQEILSWLKRIG